MNVEAALQSISLNYKDKFDCLKKGEKKIIMDSCPCHNGRGVIFAQRKKNDLILNCSVTNSEYKLKNYYK